MKPRTQAAVLVSASVVLFFIVVPVVYTSRFAYEVITSEVCSDVCGGYAMNQVCYESLSYHFFGVGGLVCHYEKGISFIS
jgi:preprotein translocase subunit SecF